MPPTSQSLWASASSSPPLGVGTDIAQPSYKDGLTQDSEQGFLQNARLVEQPFGQNSYAQRPPHFSPIPLPQVTPSAHLFLSLGSEVQQPIWPVVHPGCHPPLPFLPVSATTRPEAAKPTGRLDKATTEAFLT